MNHVALSKYSSEVRREMFWFRIIVTNHRLQKTAPELMALNSVSPFVRRGREELNYKCVCCTGVKRRVPGQSLPSLVFRESLKHNSNKWVRFLVNQLFEIVCMCLCVHMCMCKRENMCGYMYICTCMYDVCTCVGMLCMYVYLCVHLCDVYMCVYVWIFPGWPEHNLSFTPATIQRHLWNTAMQRGMFPRQEIYKAWCLPARTLVLQSRLWSWLSIQTYLSLLVTMPLPHLNGKIKGEFIYKENVMPFKSSLPWDPEEFMQFEHNQFEF